MDAVRESILTPRKYECDVCVCGGGFAGVAAALSAKRAGANEVILLERGFLGTLFAVRMSMFGTIAVFYFCTLKSFISAINVYLAPLCFCALVEYGGKSAVFKSVFAYCLYSFRNNNCCKTVAVFEGVFR